MHPTPGYFAPLTSINHLSTWVKIRVSTSLVSHQSWSIRNDFLGVAAALVAPYRMKMVASKNLKDIIWYYWNQCYWNHGIQDSAMLLCIMFLTPVLNFDPYPYRPHTLHLYIPSYAYRTLTAPYIDPLQRRESTASRRQGKNRPHVPIRFPCNDATALLSEIFESTRSRSLCEDGNGSRFKTQKTRFLSMFTHWIRINLVWIH